MRVASAHRTWDFKERAAMNWRAIATVLGVIGVLAACGQRDNVTDMTEPAAADEPPKPKPLVGEPLPAPGGGTPVYPGAHPATPGGAPAPGQGASPDAADPPRK
jgi:hypothetical protein